MGGFESLSSPNKGDYEEIGQDGDEDVDEYTRSHLVGGKTLGLFSSIVIVVNNTGYQFISVIIVFHLIII